MACDGGEAAEAQAAAWYGARLSGVLHTAGVLRDVLSRRMEARTLTLTLTLTLTWRSPEPEPEP